MIVSVFRAFVPMLVFGLVQANVCSAQGLPATATERFDALDANRDGVLSKYEYDNDVAFATIDSDRNGRISAPELQAVMGSQKEGAASATDRIRVADRDGDGELSDEELRRALEYRFKKLDSNKDGNVDPAELKSGMGVPFLL